MDCVRSSECMRSTRNCQIGREFPATTRLHRVVKFRPTPQYKVSGSSPGTESRQGDWMEERRGGQIPTAEKRQLEEVACERVRRQRPWWRALSSWTPDYRGDSLHAGAVSEHGEREHGARGVSLSEQHHARHTEQRPGWSPCSERSHSCTSFGVTARLERSLIALAKDTTPSRERQVRAQV
jgi:hypothetical protein